MKIDATENGVSEELAEETDKTEISGTGHSDELERLVTLREDQFEEDSGVSLERDREDEETETKEEQTTEKEDEKTETKADEKPTDTDEEVEIVVDGEKKMVPLSEITDAGIRSLQKESAADKRLEEATRLLKEAKEVQPPVSKEKPAETDAETDKADLSDQDAINNLAQSRKAYRDAIQYGTDEEVEKALIDYEEAQKVLYRAEMGASNATQQAGDVVDQVANKLEEREILKKFQLPEDEGGFKDLTNDPVLYNAVLIKVDELLKDGEANTWDTYQKAGDFVRNTYGSGRTQSPEETDADKSESTSTEEKLERKREIDTIPAVNAKSETTVKETKKQSPQEIVETMRQSRPGQSF